MPLPSGPGPGPASLLPERVTSPTALCPPELRGWGEEVAARPVPAPLLAQQPSRPSGHSWGRRVDGGCGSWVSRPPPLISGSFLGAGGGAACRAVCHRGRCHRVGSTRRVPGAGVQIWGDRVYITDGSWGSERGRACPGPHGRAEPACAHTQAKAELSLVTGLSVGGHAPSGPCVTLTCPHGPGARAQAPTRL